jgi:hypothetical protein
LKKPPHNLSEDPYEGKVYKVEQGKKVSNIVGVKRKKGEQYVTALVCYDDGDYG